MYCKQTVTSVLQHSHSVVEIRLQPLQLSSAWLQGSWEQDIYSNHLIWRSPGWQVDPCAWHFHFGLSLPHDVRYLCSSSHHSPQGCCLTIYLLLSILDCWHKLQIASLAKYIQDNVFDFLPIQSQSTMSLGVLSPTSNVLGNCYISAADFAKFIYCFCFLAATVLIQLELGRCNQSLIYPSSSLRLTSIQDRSKLKKNFLVIPQFCNVQLKSCLIRHTFYTQLQAGYPWQTWVQTLRNYCLLVTSLFLFKMLMHSGEKYVSWGKRCIISQK